MSAIDETFVFDSRTAHRFLLVAMVVACKGLLDQTLSMHEFAKIGGVGVWELSYLEREFLFRNNWRIFVEPELLEDYYQSHIEIIGSGNDGLFREPNFSKTK
jgi:hypothetical protein